MKARAFFYACAGVFLLASSYHIGARAALGDAEARRVECAATGNSVRYAVVDRHLYEKIEPSRLSSGMRQQRVKLYVSEPIPGTSRVVACGGEGVILENGEIWSCRRKSIGSGAWRLEGNFLTEAAD